MSPDQPPPPEYDGVPRRFRLFTDTILTRVHKARFGATEFNPTVAQGPSAGGRFDATADDAYAFLYAADDDATAVSETLLRDIHSDERGARLLPAIQLSGLQISWIRVTRELELVSLRSGEDLAAVGQDTWLTSTSRYDLTRRWASAIQGWAPWAQGLTWRSRREPDGFAYVLFRDRCPETCLEEAVSGRPLPVSGRDLEFGLGRRYVEDLLSRYRVAVL